MFDWKKYISEIDEKIENNRDECSDFEIAMMPISRMESLDDNDEKGWRDCENTFNHYFSSIFDEEHLCDVLEGDFTCFLGRYILIDGKDTNTCLLFHIYPLKGKIILDKYESDCVETCNEKKKEFDLEQIHDIYAFVNS